MAWVEEKALSCLLFHCFPLRRKKLLFLNDEDADEPEKSTDPAMSVRWCG